MQSIFNCSNSIFNFFLNLVGNVLLNALMLTCTVFTDSGLSQDINKTTGLRFRGFIFICICIGIIADEEILQNFVWLTEFCYFLLLLLSSNNFFRSNWILIKKQKQQITSKQSKVLSYRNFVFWVWKFQQLCKAFNWFSAFSWPGLGCGGSGVVSFFPSHDLPEDDVISKARTIITAWTKRQKENYRFYSTLL